MYGRWGDRNCRQDDRFGRQEYRNDRQDYMYGRRESRNGKRIEWLKIKRKDEDENV